MSAIFDLKAFYQNINDEPGEEKFEIGHFDLFKIEEMNLAKHKKAVYPKRSFFKITLITGNNRLNFANETIHIKGTALVFTNPAVPYFWDRISDKQSGYMCIFTPSFFNRFGSVNDFPMFQFTDAAPIMQLENEAIPKYITLFEKMFKELAGNYLFKYDLLRNYLSEIIHEAQKEHLQQGYLTTVSDAALRITRSFTDLLDRQFPIELKYQLIKLKFPADFAQQLNIHVNHLSKALKEITGQSTSQLINDRIISEAQALLKNTNWTISEVAYSLGFREPNNFSSFFKSRVNVTPKKFRERVID